MLEQVGGFDERYGLGFFDDDDLCLRVRNAGYRLLVALDVYIHHFGSRTFKGMGVDCQAQLRGNFEHFKAKWGEAHAAGYHLDGGSPPADEVRPDVIAGPARRADGTGRCPTSLVMMVRNEAANLPACLESVRGLFDEIIVVDTGSTDETREIARRHGARVIDFPWVDDFAAARNEGLRHATGRYVFWMDADDRLDDDNRRKLKALLDSLTGEPVAYAMPCLCVSEPGNDTMTTVQHVRLFPNLPGLAWRFRVHEQILPALRQRGVPVHFAGVTVHHTGYRDPALQEGKRRRNLRLLEMELAEQPEHPYTLFNLGNTYHDMRRPADALPFYRRSLERSDPTDSIVRKLYTVIAQCQRQLGRHAEALTACREGKRYYPDDVELHFQEAMVHRENGDAAAAEACWLRCLDSPEAPHFESVHVGIRGYLTRNNLGHLYAEQGRHAEAEAQWRAGVAEKPDALPSWAALGRLYLGQGRWPEFDGVVARLAGEPWGQTEATTLRARRLAAAGDLAAARRLLEEAAQRRPGEVGLWAMLTEVLLRQGTDPPAAVTALRRLTELDPQDARARAVLEDLLRQQDGQAA